MSRQVRYGIQGGKWVGIKGRAGPCGVVGGGQRGTTFFLSGMQASPLQPVQKKATWVCNQKAMAYSPVVLHGEKSTRRLGKFRLSAAS